MSSSWSTASSVSVDDPEPNVASLCPRPKYVYEKCFQAWSAHTLCQRSHRCHSAAAATIDRHSAFHPPLPPLADAPRVSAVCCVVWCRYTNEYLTGQSSRLPCEAEYVQYQRCLLSKLNDDVKSQLPPIDVANPGSLDGGGQGKSKVAGSGAQQKPVAGNSAAS